MPDLACEIADSDHGAICWGSGPPVRRPRRYRAKRRRLRRDRLRVYSYFMPHPHVARGRSSGRFRVACLGGMDLPHRRHGIGFGDALVRPIALYARQPKR
jgi:hypothetical protein